jgi:CelD/BcsL family acetyltransferase involved in cellulose biosynthesis
MAATLVRGGLRARVVDDARELERYRDAWDELAVASSQPYASPAWMLAWWRHAAPSRATLRVVLVTGGDELVAVAPLFAERMVPGVSRYRILGARCSSRVDLVARPGVDAASVASAIAAALSGAAPPVDVLSFDGVARESGWPGALALAWPARRPPRLRRAFSIVAPSTTLDGSFDAWFASKSRNFRQSFRRMRRQLEDLGAEFVALDDASRLPAELAEFSALHRGRWAARGGSRVLRRGVDAMLLEAGRELLPAGRFQLWSIRIDGRSVSSHLFLSAGSTTSYWLGGFDERYARYHPAMLTLLAALEHDDATAETFDLGTGDQHYKSRLANGGTHVDWVSFAPRPRFAVAARAAFGKQRLRIAAARRLPPSAKDAARAALRATRRSP